MRVCKAWVVAALLCLSSLAGVEPAAAQFPFEPGFEGELWEQLDSLGEPLPCIGFYPGGYPNVGTWTCTPAQIADSLNKFLNPADLLTVQVGTIPDPITGLPI